MLEIAETLREKNLKVTPQRMAIYTMLLNTKAHPSAEEIYTNLLPQNPTMSLATVYKTLDSFKTKGLVQELSVGNGKSNYDATIHPHPHLVCTNCNQIFDFELPNSNLLEELRLSVAEKTDFNICSEQITFYGTCRNCK
ncbi:MAG: Fur family transcriptional regulator [Anaerotignaceae bacterium]